MNLETNGAKMIAALLVLNGGLFVSHYTPKACGAEANLMASRAQICEARATARLAAMEARFEARAAARELAKASKQMRKDAVRAALLAPPPPVTGKSRVSISDYVHCLLSSGNQSIIGGS
jgi:hypothetical protein